MNSNKRTKNHKCGYSLRVEYEIIRWDCMIFIFLKGIIFIILIPIY